MKEQRPHDEDALDSEVQRLLRLKRYESPGDEYYDQFVAEFKDRQRSEMLRQSSLSLLSERASMWWREMGAGKWLIPAGAAAAAIATGYMGRASIEDGHDLPASVVIHHPGFSENDREERVHEVFQLQLPKVEKQSVPVLDSRSAEELPSSSPTILPASAKQLIREL